MCTYLWRFLPQGENQDVSQQGFISEKKKQLNSLKILHEKLSENIDKLIKNY